MKLYYQDCGTYIAIAIESDDPEEIELQYNSFYNHSATDGELHYMSDRFAYIWTDKERLEKYFLNSSFHLLLNKFPQKYKGVKGGVMADARKLAKRRFDELKESTEPQQFYSTQLANYDYSVSKSEPLVVQHSGIANDEEAWKSKAVEALAATSAKRLG